MDGLTPILEYGVDKLLAVSLILLILWVIRPLLFGSNKSAEERKAYLALITQQLVASGEQALTYKELSQAIQRSEERNQTRFELSMKTMMAVKEHREGLIGTMREDIAGIPSASGVEIQPRLDEQTHDILVGMTGTPDAPGPLVPISKGIEELPSAIMENREKELEQIREALLSIVQPNFDKLHNELAAFQEKLAAIEKELPGQSVIKAELTPLQTNIQTIHEDIKAVLTSIKMLVENLPALRTELTEYNQTAPESSDGKSSEEQVS